MLFFVYAPAITPKFKLNCILFSGNARYIKSGNDVTDSLNRVKFIYTHGNTFAPYISDWYKWQKKMQSHIICSLSSQLSKGNNTEFRRRFE